MSFSKCDLAFVCQQPWNTLQATAMPGVRYCGQCAKGVFQVHQRRQLEMASAIGRCVALTDNNEIVGWIGQPDFDWMNEESEAVAVRSQHALDAQAVSRLRLAFPRVDSLDRTYVPGTWIDIGRFTPSVAAMLEAELRTLLPDMEIRARAPQPSGHGS